MAVSVPPRVQRARTATGQTWPVNPIDVKAILAAAKRAKRAGAGIVVLSLHWGTEHGMSECLEQNKIAGYLDAYGAVKDGLVITK